jgi:hypothetical protein
MEQFTEHFFDIFEETDKAQLVPNAKFKDLDEWDSMAVLMVIAMFDDEYDVQVSGDDIKASETIEDLYNLLKK